MCIGKLFRTEWVMLSNKYTAITITPCIRFFSTCTYNVDHCLEVLSLTLTLYTPRGGVITPPLRKFDVTFLSVGKNFSSIGVFLSWNL